MRTDKYGRRWDLPKPRLCPTCGQPDDFSDCNHYPLSDKQVLYLAGELARPTWKNVLARARAERMSVKELPQGVVTIDKSPRGARLIRYEDGTILRNDVRLDLAVRMSVRTAASVLWPESAQVRAARRSKEKV